MKQLAFLVILWRQLRRADVDSSRRRHSQTALGLRLLTERQRRVAASAGRTRRSAVGHSNGVAPLGRVERNITDLSRV